MSGKTMDFACSRLYKASPGIFDGALGAWPEDDVLGCVCGFGVSWANAPVVQANATTPKQINAHSGGCIENAWLDCVTGIVPEMLIPWWVGIARDYPIASPAAIA
jgi:hypothetical protein